MLNTLSRTPVKKESLKVDYGDDRPTISLSEGLPKPRSDENSFDKFKLNEQVGLHKSAFNRQAFDTALVQDYSKLKQKPNNPVILNRIGMTYLQAGKPDRAVRFLERAFNANPKYINAAQNLARAYIMAGKLDKAEQTYKDLVALVPENSNILHELSFIMIMQGKQSDARSTLDSISSDFERYYEVLNTKGLISLTLNELNEARDYFEESKALNGNFAHAWNNIGAVYKEQGKGSKSKEYFKKAIELEPNYVAAHLNLFEVEAAQHDYKVALEHISSIQSLSSINPEIKFKMAWILMQKGDIPEAIKAYEEFLLIVPNNSSALNNLGHCYARMQQIDTAVSYFYMANKADPRNYIPVHNLMLSLTDTGKYQKAKDIADNLPDEILAKDDAAHYALAGYYIDHESWDSAESHLKKAIKLKTQIENVYSNEAFILVDIRKKYKNAINLLEVRYENGSRDFGTINNLAYAYLRSGNMPKAKKYVEMLKGLTHPVAFATKALYELQSGDLEGALQLYKEARKIMKIKFKPVLDQQMHYDLGLYYLSDDKEKAKQELEMAASYSDAKQYIKDSSLEVLESLGN